MDTNDILGILKLLGVAYLVLVIVAFFIIGIVQLIKTCRIVRRERKLRQERARCGQLKPSALGVPTREDRCVKPAGHEGKHSLGGL